jgi:hypothetical protein
VPAECQPKRRLDAALDRSGKIAGGERALVAPREQRHDLVTKIGEVGIGALAAKQRPAKLVFQLLDGLAQGGLCNVTDLGGVGEVQGLRHGQKVSDLMHFHAAGSS